MKKDLPKRKPNRLSDFDYSTEKAYFITICTKNRKNILSRVLSVGDGVLDVPQKIVLFPYGEIVDRYVNQLNDYYQNINVDQYVIMPNHIHLILFVMENGTSRTPSPTPQNSIVSRFVSTLKRFCDKEFGENVFQRSFYDHVIRNREEYNEIRKYIYENPVNWETDELYLES